MGVVGTEFYCCVFFINTFRNLGLRQGDTKIDRNNQRITSCPTTLEGIRFSVVTNIFAIDNTIELNVVNFIAIVYNRERYMIVGSFCILNLSFLD